MRREVRPLADDIRKFAKEAGFATRGSLLVKEDSLLRIVQIDMLQNSSTSESVKFDLLFDLGIPGISVYTPRSRKWIVRCYGSTLAGEVRAPDDFVLTGGPADESVRRTAVSRTRQICDEFLMRFESSNSLYRFVRDSVLKFLAEGMELHDDYRRLQLYPWNVMPRLELAGVYAAFLGLDEEADSIQDAAERFATGKNKGLDYLLPDLRKNISEARRSAQQGSV